jgi:myo-inositol-hexaphosphate 3-phosphohydrolase
MTQFEQDLQQPSGIEGVTFSLGYFNLMLAKRDLALWKEGQKPNKSWKVREVKEYFGIKGGRDKLYADMVEMAYDYHPNNYKSQYLYS